MCCLLCMCLLGCLVALLFAVCLPISLCLIWVWLLYYAVFSWFVVDLRVNSVVLVAFLLGWFIFGFVLWLFWFLFGDWIRLLILCLRCLVVGALFIVVVVCYLGWCFAMVDLFVFFIVRFSYLCCRHWFGCVCLCCLCLDGCAGGYNLLLFCFDCLLV